jgi:hypothetical protein
MNESKHDAGRRPEERLCELMRRFSAPGDVEAQVIALKNRLLKPVLKTVADSRLVTEITFRANEAAALAWYTGYPILLFPALLEEKLSSLLKPWNRGVSTAS